MDSGLEAFRRYHLASTEAFNRRDFEAAFAGLPPDFEWHPAADLLERRVLRGPREVREYFEGILEAYPDWRSEPVEYIDAGGGTFVVHLVASGAGRTTEIAATLEIFLVVETRDGVPQRLREFRTREEALAAAGPSE